MSIYFQGISYISHRNWRRTAFKIKIHPATSSVYSPHAMRKGTQSFTIHCLVKVTDEVSLYNPLIKLQLAWHYFCVTMQWCAILFLKYQGWGFSAPNVRMANIINSIWFLNGLSILQEVSFYQKNQALPAKNIKVINSFYKGMHEMQRCNWL